MIIDEEIIALTILGIICVIILGILKFVEVKPPEMSKAEKLSIVNTHQESISERKNRVKQMVKMKFPSKKPYPYYYKDKIDEEPQHLYSAVCGGCGYKNNDQSIYCVECGIKL